jgi:AcrR family transcriptional regulator
MARPKSARSEERTETSKKQIIDAAIDVIAQRGLGKSTLQNIAERAGVSSALVVFHFKSKDNLMKAVLGHLTTVYEAGWEQSLQPAEDRAAKRLMRLISYDLEFPGKHPKYLAAWYAFWGEAMGGLGARPWAGCSTGVLAGPVMTSALSISGKPSRKSCPRGNMKLSTAAAWPRRSMS